MAKSIKSTDFQFTIRDGVAMSVKYVGSGLWFERPSRLTRYDVAKCLDVFQPHLHWIIIYDAFHYFELCDRLKNIFENEKTA